MNDIYYLKRAIQISRNSREHGNTPFGALLVDKDGNILIEQENVEITESKCTGHEDFIQRIFLRNVLFIQRQSHVQCAPEQSIGQE